MQGWIDTRGTAALLRGLDAGGVGLSLFGLTHAYGMPWGTTPALAACVASCLYLWIGEHRGLYAAWRSRRGGAHARRIAAVWGATLLALLALVFVTRSADELSRRVILTWAALWPVLGVGIHGFARALAPALRARGARYQVAIAGASRVAGRLRETLATPDFVDLELVGHYDDRGRPRSKEFDAAGPRLGDFEELVQRATAGEIDLIYVALPLQAEARIRSLVERLAGTPAGVHVVADLGPFAPLRAHATALGPLESFALIDDPLGPLGRVVKRAEDIVLTSLLLVAGALPMAAIALAIRFCDGAPVLYRQRRRGLDGQAIEVRKFRTLLVCEDDAGFSQVKPRDQRTTRLGALLRASSLDELPQLWNVLTGDMSLVGPRPHPLPLDDASRAEVDWYRVRQRVKPGITGWAQVNGYRGATSCEGAMAGRIRHDLEYIGNWSIGLDLKILCMTLLRAWTDENAY